MPFKATKRGWVYDKDGTNRIPTNPNTFTKEREPMRNQDGLPMLDADHIDWNRLQKELEERRNP